MSEVLEAIASVLDDGQFKQDLLLGGVAFVRINGEQIDVLPADTVFVQPESLRTDRV